MRKKEEMTLDVISDIDDDIVEENLRKRFELWFKKSKPKKNAFLPTLIAAACLCIIITSAIFLIPNNMFGGPGITTDQPNVTQPNVTPPDVTPPTKQVPVYQGMTVSNTKPEIEESELSASKGSGDGFYLLSSSDTYLPTVLKARGNSANAGIVLLDNNNGNNGNHYGNDGDNGNHNGNDGNNGNGGDKHNNESSSAPSANAGGPYYAMKNEDIYILVHLSNPDEFEILSFTLNGVKYSSYMFESGSNLETLILKYNVGDVQGVQQYTIDAIKYVDGDKIKDVQMDGDQTIEVMVNSDDTVIDFNVSFEGWDMIISPEWSEDFTGTKEILTLGVYDGETLIKELSPTDTVISGLPAGKRLMLVATYSDGEKTGSVRYLFDTPAQSAGLIITGGVITGIGTCSDSEIYLNSPIGDGAFNGMAYITTVHLGDGVTSIGEYAFAGCTKLENIEMSDSVKSIGKSAFTGCVALKSVTLSNGIKSIAEDMFSNCSSLESVTLGDGIEEFGNGAFSGCSALKSIVIPDTVVTIGERAFAECTALEGIDLPSTLTSIGSDAFAGCTSIKSIVIPEGVKCISSGAFWRCTSLESVTLPEGLEEIGTKAFGECMSIKTLEIPESVTEIGEYGVFANCSSLESITMPLTGTKLSYCFSEVADDGNAPESLKTVIINKINGECDAMFSGCQYIETVVLPEGMTEIPAHFFGACKALKRVNIPESVTRIDERAFVLCESLIRIDITDIAKWCEIKFENEWCNPLHYGANLYLNGELVTELVIPDGATEISAYAFADCTSLKAITIPDGVTSIGDGAFFNCTSLTSITIPDGVTKISAKTFYGCSSLKAITIPDSVTSIGDAVFNGCRSLESITIPDGVTSIGHGAFQHCSSLTSITIPDSVTSIGVGALDGCTSLKYNEYGNAYYLGNNSNPYVVLIKAKSDSITSCEINDATKVICLEAFYNCKSLTSVTIGDGVTSIGDYAFRDCTSLTSVTIGDGVTSIGALAFTGCTSLTSVTIGNSVTSIGSYAFGYCYRLTSINYTGTKADWKNIFLDDYWIDKSIVIHCNDGDITV